MTTRADLIERMLDLSRECDLDGLRGLTRQLIDHRDHPGTEKDRFEGTRLRGIGGFDPCALPDWGRVLVTGGTGCIGRAVLSRLVCDLPAAQLWSVTRHPAASAHLPGVRYLRGDLRDPTAMTEVMRTVRPDVIVHLAAQRDPAYAEAHVTETVTTNVGGTEVALRAAGEAGVQTVVVASSGKAMRLFTSDVYAATKKLVEHQAARAAGRYGMNVTCTRFTHVVDNSIVGASVRRRIVADQPILLHSPYVLLPVQSALECYHLLMTAAQVAGPHPSVVALRDLGWPPVSLLDMTLDYLADNPRSRSAIVFTGCPAGYEACAYPGTYDPLTAGDVSPLVNCVEARRTSPTPVLGEAVDQFDLDGHAGRVAADLACILDASMRRLDGDGRFARLLRAASVSQLQDLIGRSDASLVARLHRLGSRHDAEVADHRFLHEQLGSFLHADSLVRR